MKVPQMKISFSKVLLAAITATTLFSATSTPAIADGAGEMMKNSAMLPVRLVSVGSTVVVGTPIALTRQVSVRIREFTKTFADKIGGHEDFPPNFFASFLSVPCGLIVGTGEGLLYGGKNAFGPGYEKPFSLQAFSLGDEIDPGTK
ncbi:MAG: hypothetical protein K2Y22_10810 [Candidatus Obscuribacterales bacterium]|nr:hypothetical protein [Candidatus Obscuribacterales bacterium]